jgi:hypothetical protein
MLLNVESVQLSKSGQSYQVKSNGQSYTCKAKGIEQTLGKTLEAVLGKFSFNGRDFPTIESFEVISGPVEAPRASDRWWLPFVSNQIAHLIQVGEIKDQSQLNVWTRVLKRAAFAMDALDMKEDDVDF